MFSYFLNNTTSLRHLSYLWEDDTTIMHFFLFIPNVSYLKRQKNSQVSLYGGYTIFLEIGCRYIHDDVPFGNL